MMKGEWLAAIQHLPRDLETIDRGSSQADRDAALAFWQLIAQAPSPIRKIYERLSEAAILARAADVQDRLGARGFGFDPEAIGTDSREAMLRLAGHLRALDLLLAEVDLGAIGANPRQDFGAEFKGKHAYIIPVARQLWRDAASAEDDKRPFSRRGFLRNRLIPFEIDGAAVCVRRAHWLGISDDRKAFGAVLFPDLKFSVDENETSFLVTAVSCEQMEELVDTAIRESHRERCMGTIFPELTIDEATRARIVGQLLNKPWLDAADAEEAHDRTPAFVIAGSWHLERGGDHYNVTTVVDGDGNPLAEHVKRLPFTDEYGRTERIEPGEELMVLVFDTCLIAFGICLDFCDRRYTHVYDQLDVDFVLIPSCGNELTMKGHISNAELLWLRRDSLTMVVQQAYPDRKDKAPGYVLPPRGPIPSDPSELVTKKSWSVLMTFKPSR